jgi:hypothetical protein
MIIILNKEQQLEEEKIILLDILVLQLNKEQLE